MVSRPFSSAWRKWERAEKFRLMLEPDFARLAQLGGETAELSFQYDKNEDRAVGNTRIRRVTVLLDDVPQLSDDFPLILGDAIHNYRSALDHMIWVLVQDFNVRLSPSKARQVQFPIHDSAADFARMRAQRTPGVPATPYLDLLKRYQPYRRGKGPQAIRWLRRLSNDDKHREVIPTVIAPQGIGLRARAFPPAKLLKVIRPLITGPSPVRPGIPVAELYVSTPLLYLRQAQIRVDTQFDLVPLLRRRMHAGGVLLLISDVTREILTRVR